MVKIHRIYRKQERLVIFQLQKTLQRLSSETAEFHVQVELKSVVSLKVVKFRCEGILLRQGCAHVQNVDLLFFQLDVLSASSITSGSRI